MKVDKGNGRIYEVVHTVDRPLAIFGKYRESMKRLGFDLQSCCFNCGNKFKDNENIYLPKFKGTYNHFLCKSCNDKALSDLRKEETE